MLDVFAYPVSVLMKGWHDVLSLALDPGSGTTWVVTIVLLVTTIRILLLWPSWRQLQSSRRLAALRPRLRALEQQHSDDKAAYVAAAGRLRQAEGVGALGCLPALLQIPVFLGLYHLLAGFTPGGAAANGVFAAEQVSSFAHATVFGVPLSAALRTPVDVLGLLAPGLGLGQVAAVIGPLLLVAAAATFVNVLSSARRQAELAGDDAALMAAVGGRMSRTMVWLAPLSLLIGGVIAPVPLALVLYWAVNGTWTTAQSLLMNHRLDRDESRPSPDRR